MRQQRGMDVEQAPAPAPDKPGCQNPHKAGEAHNLDSVGVQDFVERSFKGFAVFAEIAVIDQRGCNTLVACAA